MSTASPGPAPKRDAEEGEVASSSRTGQGRDDARHRRDLGDDRDGDRDRERRKRHRDDDEEDRRRRKDRERSYDEDREERRKRRERSGDEGERKDKSYDEDKERRRRDRSEDKERRRRDRSYDEDKERRRRDRDRKRDKRRDSRSRSPTDRAERKKRKEARAAAKAEVRRQAELEHARKLTDLAMYSAADNPFHDANLGEKFTWHKKAEKEKKMGLTPAEIARKDAIRRLEAKEELEKLNRKRAEREMDRQLRDEEEARNQALAEDAAMAEWIAREDSFLLEQSRRRAGIRLRMHRAKAIDFLAINLRFADAAALGKGMSAVDSIINPRRAEAAREQEEEGWGWADAGFEFEIDEPWRIFDNLTMDDCVELEQDIKMYLSLESSPINREFWEAMLIVCEHHLEQFRNPDRAIGGRLYNKEVDDSAGNIVAGLSLQRLADLEAKTHAMLNSDQAIDGEFWDLVLKKIHVQKAITKLNSIHEIVLKNRLEQFKRRQREDAAKVQAELGGIMEERKEYGGDVHAEGEDDVENDEDDFVEAYAPEMSPEPVVLERLSDEDRRLPIVDEEDALRALFAARHKISAASFMPRHQPRQEEDEPEPARPVDPEVERERAWRAEIAAEPQDWGDSESEMEMEEGDLADGLDTVPDNYDWSDKYRPRKPRYFNRVHTGYEWTQYNQTHYDKDNPPPKIVQGYKFNIFYPDLIDKSKAPIYSFKRIPDDPDTHIIIFHAGPPYEDIAFRIVRRPWEYSHWKGFKSNFDRGVLQLYFNFSRQFYKK